MSDQQTEPTLCTKCNQFYGNAAFGMLCSGCFKASAKKEETKPMAIPFARPAHLMPSNLSTSPALSASPSSVPSHLTVPLASSPAARGSGTEASQDEASDDEGRKVQKRKNKCWKADCGAKVSLVQQSTNLCQCGYIFCDKHRYAENHACEFDHKTSGRDKLSVSLPKSEKHAGRAVHRLESNETS